MQQLLSMTGFGRSSGTFADKTISIEIRTLNSKTVDLYFRLPALYREKELELRNLCTQILMRGKIEVFIQVDQSTPNCTIHHAVFKQYFNELKQLAQELGVEKIDENHLLLISSRMPNVLQTDKNELDSEEWDFILELFHQALTQVQVFRQEEGASLESILRQYVQEIQDNTEKVEQYDTERLSIIKEKLKKAFTELEKSEKLDSFRFEQEVIYYSEKIDISEEKTRLLTHCQYFIDSFIQENPGKKLGFIAQEMGREINTMGAKANHFEIQKLVIQMKETLEKIKEQLANIL